MRSLALAALAAALLAPQLVHAQAADLPSATPPQPAGQTTEQRGRALLDQMIAALGGDLWLNRATLETEGRASSFFHGEPNPYTSEWHDLVRFPINGQHEAERVGFLTSRGVFVPGQKVDVVQIWKDGRGYEVTYKGQTELPKEQVDDYYRRHAHSIEQVVRTWINAPGVMVLSEGTGMVERRMVDKLTILTANNDAVTLELDAVTHLPLRRTFQWRNPEFKDFDVEQETYEDYHTIQGLPTPFNITRYHNGDITNQRYIVKVTYNLPADPSLFDPAAAIPKLKK
jgi:hypothetical protein